MLLSFEYINFKELPFRIPIVNKFTACYAKNRASGDEEMLIEYIVLVSTVCKRNR